MVNSGNEQPKTVKKVSLKKVSKSAQKAENLLSTRQTSANAVESVNIGEPFSALEDSGSSTINAGSGKTIIEIVSKFLNFLILFFYFVFCAEKSEFDRTYSFKKEKTYLEN